MGTYLYRRHGSALRVTASASKKRSTKRRPLRLNKHLAIGEPYQSRPAYEPEAEAQVVDDLITELGEKSDDGRDDVAQEEPARLVVCYADFPTLFEPIVIESITRELPEVSRLLTSHPSEDQTRILVEVPASAESADTLFSLVSDVIDDGIRTCIETFGESLRPEQMRTSRAITVE